MNLWTDWERKRALETNQNQKLKKKICIIKIFQIKCLIILTPIEAESHFSYLQSVQIK